ncbi:protein of unknown function [Xenorhabdus poinarii G6]|uniref:Uncharacterized protein n=1 Tax=Xenorhabdus poinarii G6 TaxID=1354304 RepID=A0A068QZ23_9GAMM|nr:protein of unknown function [Xenorhabdus poinarii G6]
MMPPGIVCLNRDLLRVGSQEGMSDSRGGQPECFLICPFNACPASISPVHQ